MEKLYKLISLEILQDELNVNEVNRANGTRGTSDSEKSHAEYTGNLLSAYLILINKQHCYTFSVKKQTQAINKNT